MTRSEMSKHLDANSFQPFAIKMNNGDRFEIRHVENAMLTRDDSLYIFDPVPEESGIVELTKIARIHNICTIEKPIESAA